MYAVSCGCQWVVNELLQRDDLDRTWWDETGRELYHSKIMSMAVNGKLRLPGDDWDEGNDIPRRSLQVFDS